MSTQINLSVNPEIFSVNPANAQHIGRRDSQQDAFGFTSMADVEFAKHAGYLGVLADGMGGLENGSWASSQAVRTFLDVYKGKGELETPNAALMRAALSANDVVHAEADRLKLVDRMGTTLVAAVIRERELFWLNIGDSRVYLYDAGQMLQLSTDHNFSEVLNDKLVRGEIALSEVQNHPMRNALTSYLGRPEPPSIDYSTGSIKLHGGAWVLLCSDGLSGVLSEAEIAAELHGSPQAACERLVQVTINRSMPDQDNTTVILMQVPETGQFVDSGQATTRPNYNFKQLSKRNTSRKLLPWIGGGASAMAVALGIYGLINSNQQEPVKLSSGTIEVPIQVVGNNFSLPSVQPGEFIPPSHQETLKPLVGPKSIPQPSAKSISKPDSKPAPKLIAKPEIKPEKKFEVKSEIMPEAKSELKPEVKPETKHDAKPEVKTETQIDVKPEANPAILGP